jgi:hypothetical protein
MNPKSDSTGYITYRVQLLLAKRNRYYFTLLSRAVYLSVEMREYGNKEPYTR